MHHNDDFNQIYFIIKKKLIIKKLAHYVLEFIEKIIK